MAVFTPFPPTLPSLSVGGGGVIINWGCRKNGNKKSKLAPKQHEIERIGEMIRKNFENQEINFKKYFFWGVLIN